jgi:hypothetical protein
MIYLLWGLLNIALAIYFIAICLKAIKLIRENFGGFTSVIFVAGLLSFSGCFNNNDNNIFNTKTWNFASTDSLSKNGTSFLEVKLEDNLISEYDLNIVYGKSKQLQNNLPVSAYSTVTGFTSGTNWKPVSISVERTNDNEEFQYTVDGIVEWKLLGVTIYTQSKTYNGFAFTDPFKKAKNSSSL